MLDIIIIGGGPIGLACALQAQKAGFNFVILEKGTLVNSLYNYPTTMTFFSTSEKLEIGGFPFATTHPKPNRADALEYYRRVALSQNLPLKLFEEVTEVTRSDGKYHVATTKGIYEAKYVIVATGFYDICVNLDIPGEDLPKVRHYYQDPHFYTLQKVVVVGASNSSVDVALETYRKGAEVTMVVRGNEIGTRVKYWVRPDIVNRIKEGTIKAYFNSSLKAIREYEVDIETPDGIVTIPNDYVMAMTGYKPNFDFLSKIGIRLSEDGKYIPTYNANTMETNLPGVYLAGVVVGGMDTHLWFIENSRIHAEMILQDIVNKENQRNAYLRYDD
ncbi:YpdA family putative bacillithiol disulfide reductase [Mucilaginibacter sp. Bleaf8]|uniref:YpdA family putative bacillithiol disulfide reductase n=1 Tax=Mucilaginibacter sp. Bleaf8 TaxID=2834430 RepID=UPI001BD17C2D|nr:YpdA family putative bacillithiol disulfide reductase [Mucilaginibacter sp. Bleaf8]MBS7563295.1 YpdA family putative bacillithiol disulfide reductase [Mucilaginibacter sp. Bleaf8]